MRAPYPISRDMLAAQLPGHQITTVHMGHACSHCAISPDQTRKIFSCSCGRIDMCQYCMTEHFSEHRVYNMSEIRIQAAIKRRKTKLEKQQQAPRDR